MSAGAIFEIIIVYFLIFVTAVGIIGALCYGFKMLLEASAEVCGSFDVFMIFLGWIVFLLCIGGGLLFVKALAIDGNLFHPTLWRAW